MQMAQVEGYGLEVVVGNVTIKNHIDDFIRKAKEKSDVEMRQFIALISPDADVQVENNKIAPYIKEVLIETIAGCNSRDSDFARVVRKEVQDMILYSSCSDEVFMKNPELLLMAALILPDETIESSARIEHLVENYNKKECKVQWWVKSPPVNNVFTLKSIESICVHHGLMDYPIKVYSVKSDGACFFRAYLALEFCDNFWLNDATKGDILNIINSEFSDQRLTPDAIIEQIEKAISELKEIYQNGIEKVTLDKLDPSSIYEQTIDNGRFDLYCADGIKNGIALSDWREVSQDNEFYTIIANAIGNCLMEEFLPNKQDDYDEEYFCLKQNNSHNHFDVAASPDYFYEKLDYGEFTEKLVAVPISPRYWELFNTSPDEFVKREITRSLHHKTWTARLIELACLLMTTISDSSSEEMNWRLQRPLAVLEPDDRYPHSIYCNDGWLGYNEIESKDTTIIECHEPIGHGFAYKRYSVGGKYFEGSEAFAKAIAYIIDPTLSDDEIHNKAMKLMIELQEHADELVAQLKNGIKEGLGLECGKDTIEDCEWYSVPRGALKNDSDKEISLLGVAFTVMQLTAQAFEMWEGIVGDTIYREAQSKQKTIEPNDDTSGLTSYLSRRQSNFLGGVDRMLTLPGAGAVPIPSNQTHMATPQAMPDVTMASSLNSTHSSGAAHLTTEKENSRLNLSIASKSSTEKMPLAWQPERPSTSNSVSTFSSPPLQPQASTRSERLVEQSSTGPVASPLESVFHSVRDIVNAGGNLLNYLDSWIPSLPSLPGAAAAPIRPVVTTDITEEPANYKLYKKIFNGLIDERIHEYLADSTHDQYWEAVNSFREGKHPAQLVSLHGRRLVGIFFIPIDQNDVSKGGVLINLLSKTFYKVGSKEYTYHILAGTRYGRLGPTLMEDVKGVMPVWPFSQEYQNWVNLGLSQPNFEYEQFKTTYKKPNFGEGVYDDYYELYNCQDKDHLGKLLYADFAHEKTLHELEFSIYDEHNFLVRLYRESFSKVDDSDYVLSTFNKHTRGNILPGLVAREHEKAFPIITNPSYVFDKAIEERIKRYEEEHKVITHLHPYSPLEVKVRIPSLTSTGPFEQIDILKMTLRERIARIHRYAFGTNLELGPVFFEELNSQHQAVVKYIFSQPEIKDQLLGDFERYESNPESRLSLKRILHAQMLLSLSAQIENKANANDIISALNGVFTGKDSPYLVQFHGITLAKIIAVKVGSNFFLLDMNGESAWYLKKTYSRIKSKSVEHFEEKTGNDFVNVIKRNLSAVNRLKHKGIDSFLVRFDQFPIGPFAMQWLIISRDPFSFQKIPDIDTCTERLVSIHFENLRADINAMAVTRKQKIEQELLSFADAVLMELTPVLMLPAPEGALVYRVGLRIMQIAIASANVAIPALQKMTALTEEAEEQASNKLALAIFGSILDMTAPVGDVFRVLKKSAGSLIKTQAVWPTLSSIDKHARVMKYIQMESKDARTMQKFFGERKLSALVSNNLHGEPETAIDYATATCKAALTEYRKVYPLTFRRARPGISVQTPVVREPVREIVARSPSPFVLPATLANAENELRAIPSISNLMQKPAENCESILRPTIQYMQGKGMSDIKVRGMFIWSNGGEMMPANHFVAWGRLEGQDYVFDLTAAQFPGFDGPLILPLAAWEQQYQQAWRLKLIKYQDFKTIHGANTVFGAQILTQAPMDVIPGAKVLAEPGWYKAQLQSAVSSSSMPVTFGSRTPLNSAVKTSIASQTGTTPWGFPAEVLEKGQALNSVQAKSLVIQLEQMARSKNADISPLFQAYAQLTSIDDALRVAPGQLLVFVKEGHPVHTMVSLGGGRFAGMKNDVLNPALGGGKQIVFAEQLGKFEGNRLLPWQNSKRLELVPQDQSMLVYAGVPRGGASAPSMLEIATRNIASQPSRQGLPQLTTILEEASILAPEQATAFERQARLALMSGPHDPNVSWRSLVSSPHEITTPAALKTLPKGGIIVSANSETPVIMLHLGEGYFASASLIKSPTGLPAKILKAEEISLSPQLLAGQINVEDLRMSALLGPDAAFYLEGNSKLVIRAHGAPTITNYMAAPELANSVRALMLAKQLRGDAVRLIKLESCWGGLGSRSTGQILANEFNVPVIAYRWKYSVAKADNWGNSVTFRPMPAKTPQDLQRLADMAKGHEKNHEFWNNLLTGVSARRQKRDVPDAEEVNWKEAYPQMTELASLILKEQTINAYLEKNKWFYGWHDLNLTEDDLSTFKVKMKEVLENIIKPADGLPVTDEQFRERCGEVMTLNPYTYAYLSSLLE